jgi:hypothetical protein
MASAQVTVVADLALTSGDAEQIVGLAGHDAVVEFFLVVGSLEGHLWAALDHLVLAEPKEAYLAFRAKNRQPVDFAVAGDAVRQSVDLLRATGLTADGQLLVDKTVDGIVQAIEVSGGQTVVFVTQPRLIGDAFHADWSAKARKRLGLPVIHFYGGTTKLLT